MPHGEKKQRTTSQDGRCSTGISGLDEVLDDGLPTNCFHLIQGDPGSGKTTLALQFLLEGEPPAFFRDRSKRAGKLNAVLE